MAVRRRKSGPQQHFLSQFPRDRRDWRREKTMSSAKHLLRAVELASQARARGNHPFGALLVDKETDGVLLEAENSVVTGRDCTCHAEMNLVRLASQTLSPDVLRKTTLYTSTEPCPMCAGAIYWAGIREVVFGISTQQLHAIAGPGLVLSCSEVFAHGAEPVVVHGPTLPETAVSVHEGFWK